MNETIRPASFSIYLRNARNLALIGEVSFFEHFSYTRRAFVTGAFRFDVRHDAIDPDAIARNRLVVVRRNGQPEFRGIIRRRVYNATTRTWTLTGPCLKWWLSRRVIKPAADASHDSVASVPAETAMTGYVERHLTAPADSERDVNGELDGITFDVAPSEARGMLTTYNGRFVNLLTGCLQQIATSAGLLFDVVLQPQNLGYRFEVSAPRDATWSTGSEPVVFSLDHLNVAELVYTEDATSLTNAVYVLGQGQGAERAVTEVFDQDSIDDDFRSEVAADSRNNATEAALEQDGAAVMGRSMEQLLQVTMQPLLVSPTEYRSAWDLGTDVTVVIPELGISVDRRIVEVQVTLDTTGPETMRVTLGSLDRSLKRVIGDALSRHNRVTLE